MNRFFASRVTCARPSSARKRSVARFTAALPLNVSFVGFFAAARIAATSARRRARSRAVRGSVQLRAALWWEPEPHAARPSTTARRTKARTIRAARVAFRGMLENLTVDDFRPLQGDRFRIAPDGAEAFEVELVKVTEIPREPGGRAPFSLVFQGGPNPPLEQRIYRVEHDELGDLDLFLVPIATDRYEAVF